MAVAFGRYAPAKAAAAGCDDHIPADNGKCSTLNIPASPPPQMQLRGSRKRSENRAIEDASSRSGERSTIKTWLPSLGGKKETDIEIIVGAVDAALEAVQAAVETEMAAVAAMEVKDATSASNSTSGVLEPGLSHP